MDFFLLPLRIATLQLEPRSHCRFCPRGLHGKPRNEVVLIHLALNLQLFWSALTRKLQGPGYENVKLGKLLTVLWF